MGKYDSYIIQNLGGPLHAPITGNTFQEHNQNWFP